MLYAYSYDQLNRIKGMDAYNGLDQGDNNWEALTSMDAYQERVSYDANGNILTYLRNGEATNLNMDDLTYHYNLDGQGRLLNNRLDHVSDVVAATQYTEDIDDQASGNYTYDEIGNLISDTKENISSITWTVYGKIAGITKTNDPSGVSSINYTYDAAGNRISKAVTNTNGTIGTTWYVRDASGNVMATYSASGSSSSGPETYSLVLSEQHLYGSSRLGILSRNVDMKTAYIPSLTVDFIRGLKSYELSNHLGNVLVTISDKRVGHDAGNGNYDYFEADVVTANDYYPFGMMMPGRKYTAAKTYRYGFNGQEKSTEIIGENNIYTAEFWEYDTRIGRRWNIDPIRKTTVSSYVVLGNSPVMFVDPSGADWYKNKKGGYEWNKGGKKRKGLDHMQTGTWSERDSKNRSYYFGDNKNDLRIDYGTPMENITVTAKTKKWKTISGGMLGLSRTENLDIMANSVIYGKIKEHQLSLTQAMQNGSFAYDYEHDEAGLNRYYQAEKTYRAWSYGALFVLISPVALTGAVESGAVGYAYQGSSWLTRRYGGRFILNSFKQWAANNGQWSKIDWWDVSFSTLDPLKKYGIGGKVATDLINGSIDFKHGNLMFIGNGKSVETGILDVSYNLMKRGVKGDNETINIMIDVNGGQAKNKIKDMIGN